MQIRELLHDRQSESEAAVASRRRRVALSEPIEDEEKVEERRVAVGLPSIKTQREGLKLLYREHQRQSFDRR